MTKRLLLLLLCFLMAGCAFHPADPARTRRYVFTDDTGTQISVPYKPKTVAVLTSSLADLWITAGGDVDITVYETVERGIASEVILVDSGAGKTVSLELLIASQPDFVLYASDLSGQAQCAELLRDANIPAAGFSVDTFDDYLRLLRICTDILGTSENYEKHGTQLQEKVDALLTLAQQQDAQPDILFVRAGSSSRYTKAKTADNHFVCGMLKQLGTHNIAEDAPILLDGLSTEAILLADPDFIFFTTMGDESAGQAYMESLLRDPVWQTLSAVKSGNVYHLPKELCQYKPNASWDAAYRLLIRLLYGEII